MASGIFLVLDDIAVLLDDAAVMSKVAAKKTAGILGDDLAVNAEKATGFHASRELNVLWAITKGSFINKIIILPLAFLLSAYLPVLIIPILLIGGAYLSYEGVEKIVHTLLHRKHQRKTEKAELSEEEMLTEEKARISSAVRTDFILSIEIVMIALGTVMNETILLQVIVVSIIALIATVGVYGLVALIVRMDDAGFYLIEKGKDINGAGKKLLSFAGRLLVAALPQVVRGLGIIGTIAMLLVGGGLFTHNIPVLHHFFHGFHSPVISQLGTLLIGLITGGLILGGVEFVSRMRGTPPNH